jgi:hypothetical protein
MSLTIDPRYPDEKWRISFDWTPAIGTATVVSATVTCSSVGVVISEIATSGTATSFYATGGQPSTTVGLSLLATLSTGEQLGFNVLAPIRQR